MEYRAPATTICEFTMDILSPQRYTNNSSITKSSILWFKICHTHHCQSDFSWKNQASWHRLSCGEKQVQGMIYLTQAYSQQTTDNRLGHQVIVFANILFLTFQVGPLYIVSNLKGCKDYGWFSVDGDSQFHNRIEKIVLLVSCNTRKVMSRLKSTMESDKRRCASSDGLVHFILQQISYMIQLMSISRVNFSS